MQNLVFLGGIHGAGKNHLVETCNLSKDYNTLVASQLLKWQHYSRNPNNKLVNSIDDTQNRIIKNLQQLIDPQQKYILDGHFILLDAQQNIQPISEEVFKQISPRAIFIKTAPVQEIKTRLYNRDNLDWDINLLAEMQKSELSHAQHIASILKVNCFEIKDNQSQKFKNFLHQKFIPITPRHEKSY